MDPHFQQLNKPTNNIQEKVLNEQLSRLHYEIETSTRNLGLCRRRLWKAKVDLNEATRARDEQINAEVVRLTGRGREEREIQSIIFN